MDLKIHIVINTIKLRIYLFFRSFSFILVKPYKISKKSNPQLIKLIDSVVNKVSFESY